MYSRSQLSTNAAPAAATSFWGPSFTSVSVQAEAAQMWEYVFEPLATAGVYKGILADLPLTQAALYSQRTAAVHLTGAVKTYEDILWGPGVRHP